MPKSSSSGGGKPNTTVTPPDGAIVGTDGADLITPFTSGVASTAGDDVIWSLGGNDEVDGGNGNDTIEAGAGDDTIYGGAGDDVINGGDGGDTIYDGAGNDLINGGDGSDVIVAGAGSDTIDGGTGSGLDAVIYYGVVGVDYDYTVQTEIVGNGKKAHEVITGYTVTALDGSGDVDVLTNVDELIFIETPAAGDIITQGDLATAQYDGTVTVDVLANDYIEGGQPGEGLTISAIVDVQIDLDGDGINDLDLIPDGQPLSYYVGGGLLNDGSILTLNPDGTLTWDPNGVYDDNSGTQPVLTFWYEVTDGSGNHEYGDVTFGVTYPAQAGDIQFEDMVSVYDDFISEFLGIWIYQDGPDGSYWISQLTSGTNSFEPRDAGATSYDYDLDGDDEFRVWTDPDGTTHEMNLVNENQSPFDLGGMTITGLDEGETATIVFSDAEGNIVGEVTVTAADLDENNVLTFTNATDVVQFNVIAGEGDEFYIDDVFLL
jgi:hypothetical protein